MPAASSSSKTRRRARNLDFSSEELTEIDGHATDADTASGSGPRTPRPGGGALRVPAVSGPRSTRYRIWSYDGRVPAPENTVLSGAERILDAAAELLLRARDPRTTPRTSPSAPVSARGPSTCTGKNREELFLAVLLRQLVRSIEDLVLVVDADLVVPPVDADRGPVRGTCWAGRCCTPGTPTTPARSGSSCRSCTPSSTRATTKPSSSTSNCWRRTTCCVPTWPPRGARRRLPGLRRTGFLVETPPPPPALLAETVAQRAFQPVAASDDAAAARPRWVVALFTESVALDLEAARARRTETLLGYHLLLHPDRRTGKSASTTCAHRHAKPRSWADGTLWLAQRGGWDAFTALPALGVTGVGLVTCVVPTYRRHPITMAAEALTVQAVIGAPVHLGVGLSDRHIVERNSGTPTTAAARPRETSKR